MSMMASALVLGLLGSLHCLGMCGPIAFMLPLSRTQPYKKVLQLSLYHLGRLFSYALMGFAFGLVGKGLQLFGFQQKLSIGIGVLMILLVVVPSKFYAGFSWVSPLYKFVSKMKSKLGATLKKQSPDTFLTIGFLNGFLPCGLVYVALFGAIAFGTPLQGSMYMILFGLGTVPLMTSVVYASTLFSGRVKSKIRKLVPVFVFIIGLLFIVRGLGLGIPYVSPQPITQEMVAADMECHHP